MEIQTEKKDQSETKIGFFYTDKKGVIGSVLKTPVTDHQHEGSIVFKDIHTTTPDKWEMKRLAVSLKGLKGFSDSFEIGISGNDMIYSVKTKDQYVTLDFDGKFSLCDYPGNFMNIYNTEYFLQILKYVDTSSIMIGLQDGMPMIVKDKVNTFVLAPRMRE